MDETIRIKALAGYKEIFDLYLDRPMTAEEQKIFDDCVDSKISFEEYKDKLIELIIEQGKVFTNLFADNDAFDESRNPEVV